jgi:hypothetical protein
MLGSTPGTKRKAFFVALTREIGPFKLQKYARFVCCERARLAGFFLLMNFIIPGKPNQELEQFTIVYVPSSQAALFRDAMAAQRIEIISEGANIPAAMKGLYEWLQKRGKDACLEIRKIDFYSDDDDQDSPPETKHPDIDDLIFPGETR